MSKKDLLIRYKRNVEKIRNNAKACNFTDEQIDRIFEESFALLQKDSRSNENVNPGRTCNFIFCLLKSIVSFLIICLIIYITLNLHQTTSSIVLRNVQGLIYPSFKFLRHLSVPVIKKFPSLTELYDESCLVQNPYFYVNNMECWPCRNVHSVIDITHLKNKSIEESGIPYLLRTNQKIVTFQDLQKMYKENKDIFNDNANRIKTNNYNLHNTKDLFTLPLETVLFSNTHVTWRINRMLPTQLIRQLFPRPDIINKWSGQSMERFVFINGAEATSHTFPNPECSYVFLIQGSGKRTIVLKPSKECTKSCKTVSLVLKPSYILWYNWWYWRPLSLPVKNSTDVSITYMNSYC